MSVAKRDLRLGRSARLAALLVGVATAACGSDTRSVTEPDPTPTVTISVSPSTLGLLVGETATITATVSGTTESPTFSSSGPEVASVSSSGLVMAVAEGATTITASVGGQSATTAVTVSGPAFAVAVTEITQDGVAVDPGNVAGVVQVGVEYDAPPGFVGTLQVTLNGLVAGSVAIGPAPHLEGAPSAHAPVTLIDVSTTRVDDTFAPFFINGQEVSGEVRLLDDEGTVVFADPFAGLTPNNAPVFVLGEILAEQSVTVGEDQRRYFRYLDQVAHFVSYDDPAEAAPTADLRARFTLDDELLQEYVELEMERLSSGAYRFELSPDISPPGGIEGLEGHFAPITFETSDEELFYPLFSRDGAKRATIDADGKAPTVTVPFEFEPGPNGMWVNDHFDAWNWARSRIGFDFDDSEGDATVTDRGVGDVQYEFRWGSELDDLQPWGNPPASDRPTYFFEAEFYDGLQNSTRMLLTYPGGVELLPFGVENGLPTGEVQRDDRFISRWSVNSDLWTIGWEGSDVGPSGFAGFRVEGRRRDADGDECLTQAVEECLRWFEAAQDGRLEIDVADEFGANDGLWTFSAVPVDWAGNEGAEMLEYPFVKDGERPTVIEQLSTDDHLTYSFRFGDNVSLGQWTAYRRYGVAPGRDLNLGLGRRYVAIPLSSPVNDWSSLASFSTILTVEELTEESGAPTGVVVPWRDVHVEVTDWDSDNLTGTTLANPDLTLNTSFSGDVLAVRLASQSADEVVNDIGDTYDGPDPEEITFVYEVDTPTSKVPFSTGDFHVAYDTPRIADDEGLWTSVWEPHVDGETEKSVTSETLDGVTTHTYTFTIGGRGRIPGEHEAQPFFLDPDFGRALLAPRARFGVRFAF